MDGINFELHINDLFRIFDKLRQVHDKYTPYFRSKTRSAATQSFKYIQGKFLEAWARQHDRVRQSRSGLQQPVASECNLRVSMGRATGDRSD